MRLLRSAIFLFLIGLTSPAFPRAIVEFRDWTNHDGQKIRAELIGFEGHSPDDPVRLRKKGGNIFRVKPTTLIREDQALLLKVRLEKHFRQNYNRGLGAHFFYSSRTGSNDSGKTVAYIGNDHSSAWIRIKLPVHEELADDGKRVVFIGKGAGPIRLDFGSVDIEGTGRNTSVDLSLTKIHEAMATLFNTPDRVKIYIESKSGTYTEIPLSDAEKQGLREITGAYKVLQPLTADHIWWTTFQEIDPEDFKKLTEAKKQEKAAEEKAKQPQIPPGPALPEQEWNHESGEGKFTAKVTGFDRHRVNFTLADDEPRTIPVEEMDRAGREKLVSARLDHSLAGTWHPYDDRYLWFWPKIWTAPGERLEKQIILFTIDRETKKPALFLQLRYDNDAAADIASAKLQSRGLPLDLDLPGETPAMPLRGPASTKVWYQISGDATELLLTAAPGLEGLSFEITPKEGEPVKGQFSDLEFALSIEALEIYRIWKTLDSADETK